ncbi:MAG: lytic murein transglycosylase B [Vicinamibacteria bacterium]
MTAFLLTIALIPALAPSPATPSSRGERERAVEDFLEEMTARHGFSRDELDEVFGSARSLPRIVELMDRAVEPKPWEDYRSLFITDEKIAGGARFWSQNRGALELARQRYGVPEEIVTAVIGIETNYGKNKGRFKVLEALATLAFEYPRRSQEFRLELEHFLLLTREESMPLAGPLGSYAGAMGIAQFMPGSYRRYAIDFDGDGRRDLFDNTWDAIGSVANYLTAHGWERDAPVAAPAEVSDSKAQPFRSGKLWTRYPLEELESFGIRSVGASREARSAIPLALRNRASSEYWLGFDNFYVITRYNHSVHYAMAVFQLGEEIRIRFLQTQEADPN